MKRLWYLLIALLIFLPASSAGAAQRYVGIIGGLNFADLSTKLSTGAELETNLQVAYGAGLVFGFQLRENVFLQVEPQYLLKGGKLLFDEPEGSAPDSTWTPYQDFHFSFIEVPVLARIVFGEEIKRYAFFGPSFGFLLDAEVEAEFDRIAYTADIKEVSRGTDFGLLFGTGISFPLGKGLLFFDGRYAAGFANLSKGGQIEFINGSRRITVETASSDRISTKGFRIMAGYILPLGGE
jgi:hypothetical protein